MKRKVLACAMSAMCALSMLPATALATTVEPAVESAATTGAITIEHNGASCGTSSKDEKDSIADAIAAAHDGDTVVIPEGQNTLTTSDGTITVDKSITFEGEGDCASELKDCVFLVESDGDNVDTPLTVTFKNLSFTGTSQIRTNGTGGSTVDLTVDSCYAYLTYANRTPGLNAQQGQLIYPTGGYSNYLNLIVTNNTLINANTIPDEDASPVILGDGNLLKSATISGNTFGSADKPCKRVAVKFGRRTEGTQINISGNTIFGATVGDKDFNILNLYQGGGDPYDNLKVVVADNKVTPSSAGAGTGGYYAAYIQKDVKADAAGGPGANQILTSGNTAGDDAMNEVKTDQNGSGGFQVAEAEAKLVANGQTDYYATAQKAIDAAQNGGTVVLLQDVSEGFKVIGKNGLAIDCNDCTVGPVEFGEGNNDVSLRNAKFVQTDSNSINVNGVNNNAITISGCSFEIGDDFAGDTPWAMIYIQKTVTDLVIDDNSFDLANLESGSFQCIGFAYTDDMRANDATISNNAMTVSAEMGADCYFVLGGYNALVNKDPEQQVYGITGLTISGNTISNEGNAYTGGVTLSNVNGLTVSQNVFDNCAYGVFLTSQSDDTKQVCLPNTNVSVVDNSGDTSLMLGVSNSQSLTGSLTTDVSESQLAVGGAGSLITVLFDANGGYCETAAKVLSLNGGAAVAVGELPTPTHPGSYKFLGWFTESGDPVTVETTFAESTTLYAHWAYVGPVGHAVTAVEAENGNVELSPTFAYAGDKVTVTAVPDEGYEVSSVKVTDASGKEVAVSVSADGTWSFKMPSSQATVEVVFSKVPWVNPYPDVSEDDWFYGDVAAVSERGIMGAYDDGTGRFDPCGTTTRAMAATVIWRLAGQPEVDGAISFSDVEEGQWYTDAVRWAASEGITTGYDGTDLFGTNDPVTREQFAVMLYRYSQSAGLASVDPSDLSAFPDAEEVSAWADGGVRWAVGAGIVHGVDDAYLKPQGDAMRCELAAMLNRCMQAFDL